MRAQNHHFVRLFVLAGIVAASVFVPRNSGAQPYTVTYLGNLGGGGSNAVAINNNGQIVGSSLIPNGSSVVHAFVWLSGVMTDLGTLGGDTSNAAGINDAGQVVGSSLLADGLTLHAFVWRNGVMTDLGTLGGDTASAAGISNRGQVVGTSQTADGSQHAFLWQKGTMTDLGTLGGGSSSASAINNAGQVVGSSQRADGSQHAFLWQNGVMTDLGTLGGAWSLAYSINAAGDVVGSSITTDPGSIGDAFIWQKGVMTDLGAQSGADGINAAGQVVGSAAFGSEVNGAFVWQNGVMTDLSTLVGPGYASGINDVGQIVGDSPNGGGAFLLTPNPIANVQTVIVVFGTPANITLTGTDYDSPPLPLTFAIASNPTNGTLGTLDAATGSVTYTPNSSFSGTDSFTFTVSNGNVTSVAATVTLKVMPGTPIANTQTVSVTHNTAKAIALTGTDPDNPALSLTFVISKSPSHGTISGLNTTTGEVTYTPGANFQGTDRFTFTVCNGTNTSLAAAVTLEVAPGTPFANAQTVSVSHNTARAITLTGTDPDSPALPLTYAISQPPSHGTLSALNNKTGKVAYAPGANYQGIDSFTFTVSNGANTSADVTVMLKVAAGTPIANAQTVFVTFYTARAITLTGTDPDSPALPLTFAISKSPSHGTLSALNTKTGKVTYTPDLFYHGADSFAFTVCNGTNKSAPAKVTLAVIGVW